MPALCDMAEKPSSPPATVSNPQLLQPSEPKPPVVLYPSGPGPSDKKQPRRNPGVLIRWIHLHSTNPYPTKTEKDLLSHHAGMSLRQLNDWFANARRNIKKKGGYEKWKEKHPGHSATLTLSDGDYSQLYHNPQRDFRFSAAPNGGPLGLPPHPCGPLRPPCFGDNSHLAMMNGIGNGLGPLGQAPCPGDAPAVVPLSAGYYQPPCIKPLSFTSPTYSPGVSHRFDSTQVTPYSGQPVLMDGFVHPSTPHTQRAIKVYSNTGGVMMYPQLPYNYKMASSPAQLSTGSSPYSDNMSPLFGGQGKVESPPHGQSSGPSIPLHVIKEELPWNPAMADSQQAAPGKITYAYYSYVPGHAVSTSVEPDGDWGSGTSDNVWPSPEQAPPSNNGDSEHVNTEEDSTDREEAASVSTSTSSCSIENSWVS